METTTTPSPPTTSYLKTKTNDKLLEEILAIHASDDVREVDLKPILDIMEKILLDVDRVINLSCNCTGGENAHAMTLKLLETLKTYSWNTKVVLALAAFTANLGEFCLLVQGGNTNSLASSVAFLRQGPEIESFNAVRDEVIKLVKAIRNLAMCNAEFMMKLPYLYFSKKYTPQISEVKLDIIRATYWTIQSSLQIASLFGWRNKKTSLTTEAVKTLIIQLENELSQIYGILMDRFKCCKDYIGEEVEDAYERLLKLMLRPGGGDIEEILNRFLCGEGVDKVDIGKLRNKHVLFLISDLDISLEEIIDLNELYEKADNYEIVWLPVVDGLYDRKKFMELKASMKWYINVPAILEPAVIKYIKEVWHFIKNPIAVFLTPAGEVTCKNALPFLWTWGNEAFPFSAEKEKTLWRNRCDWRLDFLVDDLIDPELQKWINEGKLICLYGGGSIDWILQFTATTKGVLAKFGVTIEMVYVGKNNIKEWTGKVIAALHSHNLRILKSERHFWARLQSMLYLYTKQRQGKTLTSKDDPFMGEVMKILAYDVSEGGWTLFCKGADLVLSLEGETALNVIGKYSDWKKYAKRRGFLEGLGYYMEHQNIPHSCVQLKLPFVSSEIPGKVDCCKCGRQMEMYYMYRCCQE